MSVIRVGFVLGEIGWTGGVNYYRNLFAAIKSLPDAKIQPVVFVGLKSDVSAFDGLLDVVRTPILDRKSFPWLLSGILRRVFPQRDYLLYWLLKKNHIDVVSHFNGFWRGCALPTIAWIPDFQHIHLPQFFAKQEIAKRNREFLNLIYRSSAILLSSDDALKDLKFFCPQSATPTYVLRFVSCLLNDQALESSKSAIQKRYGLNRPWFHVPNQFWAHKNHGVIIESIKLLKQQGKDPLVVATGVINDDRNVEYFPSLMKQVRDYDLQDNFRVLGLLPYSDVVALMRYSVAIINPSLFEGWSTTVEESKAMGKKIILSDIGVHREQNPERGYYFEKNNCALLSMQMTNAIEGYNEREEALYYEKAKDKQIINRESFALYYEAIALNVAGKIA